MFPEKAARAVVPTALLTAKKRVAKGATPQD